MLMKKHLINIFFQKLKLKNTTLKFIVEIFMIKQLMIQLNNTMKSEKYQQNKVMITQLAIELDESGHNDRNKRKSLFIF